MGQVITYQEERLISVIEEIKPLLQEHYNEIARNKNIIKLNPDYIKYQTLEDMGMLHIATARDNKRLIGYCITFLMNNIHYSDCTMAVNDILFITKTYRKGFAGIKLLKYVETLMQEKGATIIHYHIKIAHDFGRLLERLGYIEIERLYEKVLIGR